MVHTRPPSKLDLEEQSARFQRGWQQLKTIDGTTVEQVLASLKDIAPRRDYCSDDLDGGVCQIPGCH